MNRKACMHCKKSDQTVVLSSLDLLLCNRCKMNTPYPLKTGQKSVLQDKKIGGRE